MGGVVFDTGIAIRYAFSSRSRKTGVGVGTSILFTQWHW